MPTSGEIWANFYQRGVNIGRWEELGLGSMAQHLERMVNEGGWSLDQAWQHVQSRLGEIGGGDGTRPPGPPVNGHGPQLLAPAPPAAPTQDEQNAKAILKQRLDEWGIGSLTDWAYEQAVVNDLAVDYVLSVLLPGQQAYKDRFAGNEERKKLGLPVLAPGTYMALEAQYRGIMSAAGLPAGFYDQTSDFTGFIGRDTSPAEIAARIEQGYLRVMSAPAEARQAFTDLYGPQGDANMAAYFLDSARATPILMRQVRAATALGTGRRTGFGSLSQQEAERIADLGLSDAGLAEGFGALVETRPLFTAIDEGEEAIDQATQLAAAFEGNTVAQQAIERRRRRRQAAFESGGGFATGQEGFAGLGRAGA